VEILKDNARPEAGAVYGAMDMPGPSSWGRSRERTVSKRCAPVGFVRDRVVEAWTSGGGTVIRLGRFWEPPVHGEFVNQPAIGIWNRPRQWCRHA